MTRQVLAKFATVAMLLAGCQSGVVVNGVNNAGMKQATEERSLSAPHMVGSGIEVTTDLGSVEVVADPSLTEAKVIANVTANGATEEEAKDRLADIRVDVVRRDDRVLAVTSVLKKDGASINGVCSFVVRIPDATGAKVRSGNGSVTLKRLGGTNDARSGMGSVTVSGAKGHVVAHSGNGSINIFDGGGDVTVDTGMGSITVENATGAVKAKSGNGAVNVTQAGGRVDAHSSMGSVAVRDAAGEVVADSGNGSVTVVKAKSAVKAHSGMGQVTVKNVAGSVDADSGNGSVAYTAEPGTSAAFHLKSSMGSVSITLPRGATGRIKADTSLGTVTVNGPGKPKSVTGERNVKTVVLTDDGPASTAHSGNGSVTITLE